MFLRRDYAIKYPLFYNGHRGLGRDYENENRWYLKV